MPLEGEPRTCGTVLTIYYTIRYSPLYSITSTQFANYMGCYKQPWIAKNNKNNDDNKSNNKKKNHMWQITKNEWLFKTQTPKTLAIQISPLEYTTRNTLTIIKHVKIFMVISFTRPQIVCHMTCGITLKSKPWLLYRLEWCTTNHNKTLRRTQWNQINCLNRE